MKVLAIDPGFDRMGVAILEGSAHEQKLLFSDCITPKKGAPSARLSEIHASLEKIITEYAPERVAVETLFFNINKKTAIGVAQARGVVLAVAGLHGKEVIEISPQQVKLAVTGYGGASKEAVSGMVTRLVTLSEKKRVDDELDAIALGIAALVNKPSYV